MYSILDIDIQSPDFDFENKSILKITINRNWSVSNFSELYNSIDIIYQSKLGVYSAIQATKEFILNPNNKNVSFMQFAHTPLARILEAIKENLKNIETEDYKKIHVLSSQIPVFDILMVDKISYASPGFTDIFGISGILKEIKEVLMYYFPNQHDKEKAEIIKQKKIDLQIKNLKNIGFTDIEIKTIFLREDVKFDKISKFIENGLIEKIEVIEN